MVAQEPAPGQGLDCDINADDNCGHPPDAPIRLKFDRWLLPTTAVRQSLALYTAGTGLGVLLRPDYDVTARVLSYRTDAPLTPGAVYTLQLSNAGTAAYGFGFRSFDGDSLGATATYAFRTSLKNQATPSSTNMPAATCADALSMLAKAGCSNAGCHSRQSSLECDKLALPSAFDQKLGQCVTVPRMGLSLEDASGLLTTAINQVSRETELGTDITQRAVSGGRFGTQMPLIDAGRPENSYLMYKLLIGNVLNHELSENNNSADPFATQPLSPMDIQRARAQFIGFGAMPPDDVGYPAGVSPLQLVTTLQSWIRAGAVCE